MLHSRNTTSRLWVSQRPAGHSILSSKYGKSSEISSLRWGMRTFIPQVMSTWSNHYTDLLRCPPRHMLNLLSGVLILYSYLSNIRHEIFKIHSTFRIPRRLCPLQKNTMTLLRRSTNMADMVLWAIARHGTSLNRGSYFYAHIQQLHRPGCWRKLLRNLVVSSPQNFSALIECSGTKLSMRHI